MNKKCRYCTLDKWGDITENNKTIKCKFEKNGVIKANAEVDVFDEVLSVRLFARGEGGYADGLLAKCTANINYCPMCGRKL